nr:MAG TPA: hypothetical protein [Caudoviricetes sp.]
MLCNGKYQNSPHKKGVFCCSSGKIERKNIKSCENHISTSLFYRIMIKNKKYIS